MKKKQPVQSLLIDVPENLSPKLQFLKEQGLFTKKTSKSRWKCEPVDAPQKGVGRNEEDAIIDYCEKNQIKYYKLP